VLNLVMTHSPRLAALANGKPYGPDSERAPAVIHRMAWLRAARRRRVESTPMPHEAGLQEQPATP